MYFGKISYTVYLFHTAILGITFSVVRNSEPELISGYDWLVMGLAFSLTVGLAEVTWRVFESRMIDFGRRFQYGRRDSTSEPLTARSLQT
jgi:peptidoglycan/LPS O-acetylase OafA/YrhL